jgi:hypothetical protein
MTLGRAAEFVIENQSPQLNPPTTAFTDFTPEVDMLGAAYSTATGSYSQTISSDQIVFLLKDFTNSTTHLNVGTKGSDDTYFNESGRDILQLFYRGTDNSLYTRWRTPVNGNPENGSWSGERHLGGILNGDPIAAQVPGTDILQLFYRGTDNSLYTRWRNPETESWSGEQHLGGTLNGDPIAAQVPGTDILQLFYRGTDDSLYTRWRNPENGNPENGSWFGEQHLGGILSGGPIAAQVP